MCNQGTGRILHNSVDQKNRYEKLIKRNPCIFDLREQLEELVQFLSNVQMNVKANTQF